MITKKQEQLINEIIDLKFKNGKQILKPKQQDMLAEFRDFDMESDFMDSKKITKIEKILQSNLPKVLPITPKVQGVVFSIHGLYSLDTSRKDCSLKSELFRGKYSKAQHEEADRILSELEVVQPIIRKVQFIKEERAIRNGKLPKKAREEIERKEIKRKLDPQFKKSLEDITSKFFEPLYDFYKSHYESKAEKAVEFFSKPKPDRGDLNSPERRIYEHWKSASRYYSGVVHIDGTPLPKNDLHELAKRDTQQQLDAFFFKMADKLGGITSSKKLKKVESDMLNNSTAMESTIRFKFEDGSRFRVVNKVVTNRTPEGKPYHQFPCTFHNMKLAGGRRISNPSEYVVKEAFNTK